MFSVVIEIKAPEIVEALRELSGILGGRGRGVATQGQNIPAPVPGPAAAPAPEISYFPQAQTPTAVPASTPTPNPALAPMQTPAPALAPAAVPTTAPTYTMEQLAVAATQLVDAGRRTELVGLLASFGVQALTSLPKEHYGAFATQLRAMGAKI